MITTGVGIDGLITTAQLAFIRKERREQLRDPRAFRDPRGHTGLTPNGKTERAQHLEALWHGIADQWMALIRAHPAWQVATDDVRDVCEGLTYAAARHGRGATLDDWMELVTRTALYSAETTVPDSADWHIALSQRASTAGHSAIECGLVTRIQLQSGELRYWPAVVPLEVVLDASR